MYNSNNAICTKDKSFKSIYNYLFIVLCSIGFSPSCIGTKYIIELSLFYYFNSYEDLNLEDLYDNFVSYSNKSLTKLKIRSNVNSCFKKINFEIAKRNFEKIFNIQFDYSFFTTKNIIIFLINLLTQKNLI